VKVINEGFLEYDFNFDENIKEETREFDIYGLDPFSGKNKTPLANIKLTGYSTKLDEIELVLRNAFI
jgi:hypothetical protein